MDGLTIAEYSAKLVSLAQEMGLTELVVMLVGAVLPALVLVIAPARKAAQIVLAVLFCLLIGAGMEYLVAQTVTVVGVILFGKMLMTVTGIVGWAASDTDIAKTIAKVGPQWGLPKIE